MEKAKSCVVCGNCGDQDVTLYYDRPSTCNRCNQSNFVEVLVDTDADKVTRAYIEGALVCWRHETTNPNLIGNYIHGSHRAENIELAKQGFLDYQNGIIEVHFL